MSNQKITVVAKIVAKEGKLNFVKAELLKLIDVTRAEEGNINYDLHQDIENPNLFIFHENWESAESLQKHLENTHMAEYIKATENAIEEFIVHKMIHVA